MKRNLAYLAAEFYRIAEQLQRERAEAAPIVKIVSQKPWAYAHDPIPERWTTAGLVLELTAAADGQPEAADPRHRLALALLATRIAAALDDRTPEIIRAQATAHAWRALAEAHSSKGDHPEALLALDHAHHTLRDHPALTFDRATLQLTHAHILHHLGRGHDALAQLAEARTVLHDHGAHIEVAQCDRLLRLIESGRASGREE